MKNKNRCHSVIIGAGIVLASLFSINKISAQDVSKHTIASGETLSKIASNYGTTVGDIMRFNGMDSNSKLTVGSVIKIPPAGVHIIGKTSGESTAPKAATPLVNTNSGKTHTVATGESLYKISRTYGVSVDNLKKWNNLSDNGIRVGQVLQLSDTPASNAEEANASISSPEKTEVKPIAETPKSNAVTDSAVIAPKESKVAKTPVSAEEKNPSKIISSETTTLANGGGAFVGQFGQDVENMSLGELAGKAKTFKSQSGWSDQKYYIMMNDVTPGGIVKVTYNGNSIFAKVLWNLIDTKENKGLNFRISDAAASALGITGDNSFDLKVDYYK